MSVAAERLGMRDGDTKNSPRIQESLILRELEVQENYHIKLAREHGMQERVRIEALKFERLKEGPKQPPLEYWTSQVPDFSKLAKPKPERPKWDYTMRATILRKIDTKKPVVALTIDDGFSNLDEVLNTLKDKKVNATFFLIGRLMDEKTRPFIERALSSGCEIANHTMSHGDPTKKPKAEVKKDIQLFEIIVENTVKGATTVPYMRPSGGATSVDSIAATAEEGYRTILWGVSGDAGGYTPSQLVNLYLNQLKSLKDPRGSIILMHFQESTRRALPEIIDGIRSMSLEPTTLTECLFPD